MRIAYTTTFDANDVHHWSGTPYHMARAFIDDGMTVDYIGPLERKLPRLFKLKQIWHKTVTGQRASTRYNIPAAKEYAAQVAKQLASINVDAIVAPLINPIAFLDCKQPIVLWTDALYAGLLGFYATSANHSVAAINESNAITAACLARCKLAIFSSDWAANTALQHYGADKTKVRVVPYGANITSHPDENAIGNIISARTHTKIKLLFLAKEWERKGGDTAVAVARALHAAGHAVELTIVGYSPSHLEPLPSYVTCLGFISKRRAEGQAKINELLAQSHFLILPSRADACPMVFAEANAFGLPCLTTYVGGIATAIKNDINGMTFALDAPVERYCDYIVNTMTNRARYEELALSAYNEYKTQLNWQVAVAEVREMIETIT